MSQLYYTSAQFCVCAGPRAKSRQQPANKVASGHCLCLWHADNQTRNLPSRQFLYDVLRPSNPLYQQARAKCMYGLSALHALCICVEYYVHCPAAAYRDGACDA